MSDDRRSSIRRHASLPFAWRPVAANASMAEVCQALGVPAAAALHSRMAELDGELRRLCAALPDASVADAVRLLDDKVALLEEALMSQTPLPPAQALEISADGISFNSPQPVQVGSALGIHLVLPVSYHLVCRGRVSHCAASDGGHHLGVALQDMEDPAARRLTRFAIGRDHGADAD